MSGVQTGPRRPVVWLVRATAAVVVMVCLFAGGLLWLRESPVPSEADIVFERANLRADDGRLLLDAQVNIELPPAVREGLDSGVPLDFIVELAVREPRRLRPDPIRYRGQWRFRLVYYELTRHYRLGSSDTGTANNYRSVLGALDALGRLHDLDVGTGRLPMDGGASDVPAWRATLDMRLDTGGLPLPLQPFIGTSWRMRSAPFAWTVAF